MMYIRKFNYEAYRNLVKYRVVRVGLALWPPVVLVASDAVVDCNTLARLYFCSESPDITRRTHHFFNPNEGNISCSL